MHEIIVDIAHNILRISDPAEECIAGIAGIAGDRPVSLTVAGPTGHLAAEQRSLKSKGLEYQLRQHRTHEEGIVTRGKSDIVAIVGMAGPFPGSENIEGYFEDLVEKKVQLKKVRNCDSSRNRRSTVLTHLDPENAI